MNDTTQNINDKLITLVPIELEHIYEHTFNEYLDNIDKFKLNLDDKDPYINIRTAPLVVGVVGKALQRNLNMPLSEVHARATQLGTSKIQHYEWVKELVKLSYDTLNSGELFGSYGILSSKGYPYNTEELKTTFSIRVKEWVHNVISDTHVLLGIPKSQLTCICFMEGIKDYFGLHPNHKNKIDCELKAFRDYVEYKTKVLK